MPERFRILKRSQKSRARMGVLKTPHGNISTPFFMPVGTRGVVKTLTPKELEIVGSQIMLANTLHLFFNPGLSILKKTGGLHNFVNWQKPILTDSGGYQVFSLSNQRKIKLEGVEFHSPIDSSRFLLTPEKCLKIQKDINSDIWMTLDECPEFTKNEKIVSRAVERTTLWAQKSRRFFESLKSSSLLFGITQGGVFKELREKSIKDISKIGFEGYAIGGLFVGEPLNLTYKIAQLSALQLPENAPRYLMGGARPEQVVKFVKMGIDMFDCVIPSRHARHGQVFVFHDNNLNKNFYKTFDITKTKYKSKLQPIDPTCDCPTCKNFSISFIHHAFRVKDPLGPRLATIHNIRFYNRLMEKIRQAIKDNQL